MDDVHAWLEALRAVPLRRLTFTVTLAADVALADPLCSVVRGLAAASLRAQRCVTGARRCDGCEATARCDYAALVGTRETPEGDSARPWWFDGVPGTTSAAKETRWRVTLTMLDGVVRATALAASMADALERVGVTGTTRHAVQEGLASAVPWPALEADALRLVSVSPWLVRPDRGGDLAKSTARCPQAPWLGLLAGSIVRRCSAVVEASGAAPPGPLRLPDLRAVRCVEGGWSPWRGSRYSHAQERRMPLEGYAGDAVLEGAGLDALAPLLAAATVVGAGRLRTMGFGSLRVQGT